MKFFEIGNYKLNPDLILWAVKSDDYVNVVFSGGPEVVVFEGEDGRTVWRAIKAIPIATHDSTT